MRARMPLQLALTGSPSRCRRAPNGSLWTPRWVHSMSQTGRTASFTHCFSDLPGGRRRFQHTKNGDSIGKTARRAQARAARMTAEYRLADPFSRIGRVLPWLGLTARLSVPALRPDSLCTALNPAELGGFAVEPSMDPRGARSSTALTFLTVGREAVSAAPSACR